MFLKGRESKARLGGRIAVAPAQLKSVLQDEGDGCNVEIAEKHFITLNSGCSCRK